ncbi:uncharacterized protein TRIVIDRAFT_185361 [Trichoderma virens Gv29-8]|uniref:Uncharacterized protein n=1 Tax=Hypocrea virens (strain Gv29-8 / FGSC 10586) TaxID=413071 RepID=G9MFP7_HYPVG|nr:uncharacterized protein TRIVIDRAFT_185361 [Trichoderma virens Gv29-8]EHK26794.1 hypothetical protein TRIVIDRAFT_185361 [Trichoderma virens Gv29-8]
MNEWLKDHATDDFNVNSDGSVNSSLMVTIDGKTLRVVVEMAELGASWNCFEERIGY